MLLTLTTTHQPATDLGFLLHKHPDRVQSFDLPFGRAHVFYPAAAPECCTAALLLDVDPVGLVRGRQGPAGEGGLFERYVNDRPYAASSFLSVAIAGVFRAAMAGRCTAQPELVETAIPLEARISALPCRGGARFLQALFRPLGYETDAEPHPLDARHPEWGASRYFTVTLRRTCRLRELLTHLYVLIPVLDDEKHYWVGEAEVDKLLRHGEGWLAAHPEKDEIAKRYLRRRGGLVRDALDRLTEQEEPHADAAAEVHAQEEAAVEKRITLNEQRMQAVMEVLREVRATRVLDLGCGEGTLLRELLKERAVAEIVGVDVSHRALEIAADRLRLDRLPERQRERVKLLHGALTYRDARLNGFDAAAVVEVVEHFDPPRLAAFERVLFEAARPGAVVLTTPNREYNVRWESLPGGAMRHKDHRFEWTRAEFQAWATAVGERFGYAVEFRPVGPEDPELGPPTQMALFTRSTP